MTWVKLDDNFHWHPKIDALSPLAYRIFVGSICYANRYQTAGFIRAKSVRNLCGVSDKPVRNLFRPCAELVRARLWEKTEGGWLIHDYFEYQPDPIKQSAGRKGGLASVQARAQAGGKHAAQAPSRPVPVKEEESNWQPSTEPIKKILQRITEDPATHPLDCECGAHQVALRVIQ